MMMTRQAGDWGLGLRLSRPDSVLRFQHTGSGAGFKAIIVGYPARGAGAVVLANADGAGALRTWSNEVYAFRRVWRGAPAGLNWRGENGDEYMAVRLNSGP